jgi:CelD/BcsL family acetyltransferase involved in cellulose biosynthesis
LQTLMDNLTALPRAGRLQDRTRRHIQTADNSSGTFAARPRIMPLCEAAPVLDAAEPALAGGHSSMLRWASCWAAEVNPNVCVALWLTEGLAVMALPLEIVRKRGITFARHVGGSHANANFPLLWSGAERLEPATCLAGLCEALASAHGVDVLMLERQLETMNGWTNPLVSPDASTSPNVALHLELDQSFDALLDARSGKRKRKRNRSQQRKFESAGGLAIIDPVPADQSAAVLDTYFAMKLRQLSEKGIAHVFDEAAEQAFFKALIAGVSLDDAHAFGLSVLEVGGIPRSIYGWSVHGSRKTVHFTSFAKDELTAASPGDYLNYALVERACAQGLGQYDLGVGDEPYKRSWCDIETWHRDTVIGLSTLGRLEKLRLDALRGAKRFIKNSPPLWSAAQKLRRLRAGRAAGTSDAQPDTAADDS